MNLQTTTAIHPSSTAGILLREFSDPAQALHYAEHYARGSGSLAEDYAKAAQELRQTITGTQRSHGILKQLIKALVERALQAELTDHLGHCKNQVVANEAGNTRTGAARRLSRAISVNCPLKSPATALARSSPKSSPSTRPVGAALTTRYCRCTHGA